MKKYPVYDPDSMKKLEKEVILKRTIAEDDLVFEAGLRLVEHIIAQSMIVKDHRVLVLVGYGNNGMDAYWIGLHLEKEGHDVTYVHLRKTDRHEKARSRLGLDAFEKTIQSPINFNHSFDRVIDGLFGIGLHGPMPDEVTLIIEAINRMNTTVISIDLPSGIDGRNGRMRPVAIHADYTLVVHAYKSAHFLGDAMDCSKVLQVVDMDYGHLENHHMFWIEPEDIIHAPRKHASHKYDYGHVLVIGGNHHMMGAPILSSLAALRSGAGLVTWVLERREEALAHVPFDIIRGFYETEDELLQFTDKKTAIVFGPGLGKKPNQAIYSLLSLMKKKIPLLIDADGLRGFKSIEIPKERGPIVLTPHLGEWARLNGKDDHFMLETDIYERLSFSDPHLYIVLKGPCTLVKTPHDIWFIPIGHPGLAKAGTGDILSGILGAMMGQYPVEEALIKGLSLYHWASLKARDYFGESGMMASDLLMTISEVLKERETDGNV